MKFFKKMKKTMAAFGVALAFAGTFAAGIGAFNTTSVAAAEIKDMGTSELNLDVKAGLAVDAKSGQILYSKNAEQVLPIASLSKLLTVYLVLQAIHEGKLSWNQKIVPDEASQKVSQDTNLSNVPLKEGHAYTVKALYQATLIYSANGAAMALGNAVAGSHKGFIDMMRKQAQKFGINDAKIYTANGLSSSEVGDAKYPGAPDNAENEFSAKDMAIIAQRLLKDYPEVLDTTKITRMKFDNGTDQTEMENWNWMLKGLAKSYTELPVDGLKTGTSDSAGACFVATVKKDGHRIITVVLGAKHTSQEDLSRFEETQKLMSYVFNNYNYTTLKAGMTFKGADSLPVHDGKELTTKVALKDNQDVWLKNGVQTTAIKASVKADKKLYEKDGLQAPLSKGQSVGTLALSIKGQDLAYLDGATSLNVKAKTTSEVKKANIFVIGWRAVKGLFNK